MTDLPENDETKAFIASVVAERRGQILRTLEQRDGLTIAIGTAPQGLSLANEVRLAKAALLYADRVVLYSPSAVMLSSAESLGRLDDDALIAFMRQLAPMLRDHNTLAALSRYEELRGKRRRSRQEIIAVEQFKQLVREAAAGFANVARGMLEEAGAADLQPGLEAGLIEIDPLVAPDAADVETAYLAKLGELLRGSNVYPLFDDLTGDLVRVGVAEGLFEMSTGANRRGRQVAAATSFIGRMPSLPRASMDQVIGVRSELRESLARFRSAVIRLSRLIEADLASEDLAAELQDLYDADVAPVLEEIGAAFTANTYLRELLGSDFMDVRSLLAYGAGLVAGIVDPLHLSGLASGALGASMAAAPLAVPAAQRVRVARATARQDQLYFLYRANERLADRSGSGGDGR